MANANILREFHEFMTFVQIQTPSIFIFQLSTNSIITSPQLHWDKLA